jgi:hypothetical protein
MLIDDYMAEYRARLNADDRAKRLADRYVIVAATVATVLWLAGVIA